MPGTFFPPPRVSNPDMHHGTFCLFAGNYAIAVSHESHGVSNHWQINCLFNSFFRLTVQTPNFYATAVFFYFWVVGVGVGWALGVGVGVGAGAPVTGGFPSQWTGNTESVFLLCRLHLPNSNWLCLFPQHWAFQIFISWYMNIFLMRVVSDIHVICSWITVDSYKRRSVFLTTSWRINAFRITGSLWGESIGHQWIPLTKGQ